MLQVRERLTETCEIQSCRQGIYSLNVASARKIDRNPTSTMHVCAAVANARHTQFDLTPSWGDKSCTSVRAICNSAS